MGDGPPIREIAPPRRVIWPAVTAFTAVVLALLALIAWRERRETHDYWRDRLVATARQQADAVSAWIDEHAASAALLATAPSLRQRLDPALEPSAGEAHDSSHLLRIVRDARAAFGLEGIWLVDAEGSVLLREGADAIDAEKVAPLARRAVAASAPTVGALVLPDGRRLIALATPLRRDKTAGPTVGGIVVFSDAATRLWPSIAQQPGDAHSAESLLIERRETESVVLSPLLQEPPGAAASGRPGGASHAALGALGRMVEAPDYRAVPVLATARAIPGTDWSIVVKVDRREAYDRWRAELGPLLVMAGLVVLAAIGVGQALSRREHARALTAELVRERALQQAHERSEREIRRLNAELEQRVHDRTVALEGANRELESFNYSVSHDLRAPLRHIEGFLRIVMEDHGAEIPAAARGHLDRVWTACQRMEGLIDALLALSRVGRHELQRRPVDLGDLARTAFAEIHAASPDRRIELAVGALPTVSGDPALLRELLDNLLANAVKFTRPRPVAHIEVGQRGAEGAPAFYVRDDGVGFDTAYAHKLFAAFQRLHRTDEFEGSGLGLSIVKRIVDKHGGRVWAEGSPDAGATFFFTLGGEPGA